MKENNNCYCPFCNQELLDKKIFCYICQIEFRKYPACERLIPKPATQCPYYYQKV